MGDKYFGYMQRSKYHRLMDDENICLNVKW